MLRALLYSSGTWSSLILRLFLGIVMLPHGAQKMFGLFGGQGFMGTMNFFHQNMGIPTFIAFLIIFIEFFGSLAILFGFLTRLFALGIVFIMVGAIIMVHFQHGFFMNWQGQQAGEGFEYHLLAIGMGLSLTLQGAGIYSIDHLLSDKHLRLSKN